MTITADFSGAIKKTAMLNSIPKAARYQLAKFATETVRDLKISARDKLSKSGRTPGRKTGHLWRNIGQETLLTGEAYRVTVGTGVQGKVPVKYAWIQDQGGTTHPTVTPRMRRWAWAMYYKSRKMDTMFKAIALTKKDKLTVKIPPTHWFSDVIKRREPLLKGMMLAGEIQRVAETEAMKGATTDASQK